MITARNYAAMGYRDFIAWFNRASNNNQYTNNDITALAGVYLRIKHAVHFAVPDGGRIFDKNLESFQGEMARLPFDKITVEYFSKDKQLQDPRTNKVISLPTKTVIYAETVEPCEWLEKGGIFMATLTSYKGKFTPAISGAIIPADWDMHSDEAKAYRGLNYNHNGAIMPFPLAEDYIAKLKKEKSARKFEETLLHSASNGVRVVLELLEALSCSNVGTGILQKEGPNKKRIAKGKLPFYETRVLVVDTGKEKPMQLPSANGGTHASPRQHLRCGHPRRLQSGRKVWVRSCVVGKSEDGFIDKTYDVC